MHTLFALLTVATMCVLARPPGLMPDVSSPLKPPRRDGIPLAHRHYPLDYLLPRFLIPHHLDYTGGSLLPRLFSQDASNNWLNKEISHIEQMQEDEAQHEPRMLQLARGISQDPLLLQMYVEHRGNMQDTLNDLFRLIFASSPQMKASHRGNYKRNYFESHEDIGDDKTDIFAYTPLDKGYYDPFPSRTHGEEITIELPQEGVEPKADRLLDIEPPRQIRQNPNLSKTKTLVAENLDKLRMGVGHDYGDATDRPGLHFFEPAADPANSIYGVALIAAVSAALAIAILGFAFGWYTLSRKAKAAADVDYPAYGVTGPTLDVSGDRKLAHSAHMYHYQHQKQQIIAMERSGLDQRNGSVSDPESEDENEEGDYTVYECPGFATTGDMEVKNPLFSDDPTPATPGKCEVVKPQPKD